MSRLPLPMRFPLPLAGAITLGVLVMGGGVAPLAAQAPSAQEILKRSFDAQVFESNRASADITLIDKRKNGNEETRRITIKAKKTADGLNRFVLRFTEPDKVKGVGFLTIERKGADDDQFLYLPALKKTKRILSSERNSSFMGTQFSYADMQSRDLDEGTHKMLPDEKLGNFDVFVVESVPKAPKPDDYAKTISYIRKDNFVPVRVKFFDKAGDADPKKVMTTEKAEKRGDRWVVLQSNMTNLLTKESTRIVVDKLDLETDIPDGDFSVDKLPLP